MSECARYFAFLEDCKDAKACTVILRGGSKDVLNEIERNLQDAMQVRCLPHAQYIHILTFCHQVAKNILLDPRMLPGGGATELAVASAILKTSDDVEGVAKLPYAVISSAFEVIPRTLAENCGANVIRVLTELRAKHSLPNGEGSTFGVNGDTGAVTDMNQLGVWEPFCVKTQTFKTAIESSCMILRIDDVVSGTRKKKSSQ